MTRIMMMALFNKAKVKKDDSESVLIIGVSPGNENKAGRRTSDKTRRDETRRDKSAG